MDTNDDGWILWLWGLIITEGIKNIIKKLARVWFFSLLRSVLWGCQGSFQLSRPIALSFEHDWRNQITLVILVLWRSQGSFQLVKDSILLHSLKLLKEIWVRLSHCSLRLHLNIKCISPNFKMYLGKMLNIFLQFEEKIAFLQIAKAWPSHFSLGLYLNTKSLLSLLLSSRHVTNLSKELASA